MANSPSIFLVSCVAKKRDHPMAAGDLYCSDWFQKARAYAGSMLTFLAGEKYRELQTPSLRRLDFGIEVPMNGLRIGEQLSRLAAHTS